MLIICYIHYMQFNRCVGLYTSIRLLFLVNRNVEISATALCHGLQLVQRRNSRDDFRLKIYLESHFK